jgi:O-antigen ligase
MRGVGFVTTFDRKHVAKLADSLVVALAVSLPWSTSATAVVAGLCLLALLPTLDFPSLRRAVFLPAGATPVLFVVLGGLGMLWADVSWAERFDGIGSFIKFLFIPLLLHRFCRSDGGRQVLIGFLCSCIVLLIVSWSLWVWPWLPWLAVVKLPGIPVKDYISQSAMFTICALVIVRFAFDMWQTNRRWLAAALFILSLAFVANVFYVATSRTFLLVIPILLVVFGYQAFGWKGAASLAIGIVILAMAAWPSASSLRVRVSSFFDEVRAYQPTAIPTPAGLRLEFWRKSLRFIEQAPLLGHGTGSIRDQFRRSVAGQSGMAAEIAANPHNQALAVGIQLGIVGIAVLLAMWIAHLALFRSDSFAAWVGLVVVVQNIMGSLFNSHLFDFTQGWAYVVGVGVAGGSVLKRRGWMEEYKRHPNKNYSLE